MALKSPSLDFQQVAAQFRGLNPRDPGTWPVLPKLAALVGLLLVLLLAGWYFYWSGKLSDLDQAKQEEVKLKDDYKNKLQQAINLEALKKQKEQVSQYVTQLEKQLPSKAEMDALLSDINQAGLGRGLSFLLFRPGQVALKDYYAELPIQVAVTGGYHDIGAFAGDIANLPRIVTLNDLDIKTDKDGSLNMNAVAKTFRYLDPDEVAAQKKAAAAKKEKGKK